MARGGPDYGQLATETVIKDIDEISVDTSRVGFSRVDGGGRVIWFDDFSQGVTRVSATAAVGGLAPYPAYVANRGYGFSTPLKMDPQVNGGQSIVSVLVPIPQSGKIGFEIGFYLPENHGNVDMSFLPLISSGSQEGYLVRLENTTNKLQLYVDTGYQTIFTPVNAALLDGRRFQVKVVADPVTMTFERVYFGNNRFDVSYAGQNSYGTGEGGGAWVQLLYQATSAVLKEPLYLGYVLISADEP